MRGYPPLYVFLVLLAFAAMAVPLVQLTRTKAVVAMAAKPDSRQRHTGYLRVRFAHAPKSLSIKPGAAGPELLRDIALDVSPIEVPVELDVPVSGMDFLVTAEWPEGTPDTALTVELELDGLDSKTDTRWSAGASMTEVMGFQWN